MTRRVIVILSILSIVFTAMGQQALPMARNVQPAFDKETRSSDGKPGRNYWQNHASYDIHVNFSSESKVVSGTENILYYNNSPDTLRELWFKLFPNLYKIGALRNDSEIHGSDMGDGVTIRQMSVNGIQLDMARIEVFGTTMKVNIPGLVPKGTMAIALSFSYVLNKTSHIRTGMIDDSSAFVAYFFPRVAVYDDIDGWDKRPYLGLEEFYNDFCDFDVSVTVPRNYLVWATGDLTNPSDVMNPPFVRRLQAAERTDGITVIIDSAEAAAKSISVQKPAAMWHFQARNVTDFAFATSNHYMWYASSVLVDPSAKRRTRVDAVFNPTHMAYREVATIARKTVEAMSTRFPAWPFPYSHETVVDGLSAMEYPMMVNVIPGESRWQTIRLDEHEIFHTMFPFYMGINETKYAWMDEGWANIGEWVITPMIDSTIINDHGLARYNANAGNEFDLPIMTLSTQLIDSVSYKINSYHKPALGYLYAKDMLGDSLFLKGLHYYISQWHGKHPIPMDFFNCMNAGTGRNLNWFWKRWFFDNGYPDLAIAGVDESGKRPRVTVEMKGEKPVPIHMTVYNVDGSIDRIHYDVSCWEKGNTSFAFDLVSAKPFRKLVLGDVYDADVNKKDNVFENKR